eukprot:g17307.t1
MAHFPELRTLNGCISHRMRLAIGLRILAGGSYVDAAVMFGVALPMVYETLWLVIDAINSTLEIGPFSFPQDEVDCRGHSARFKRKSSNGVLDSCVACVDGLFVKTQAPSSLETANVLGYYSGQKSAYGINVQAMCTADYRFTSMSAITPGATNDWAAWNRSKLSAAICSLPKGYYGLGDAAYPLNDQLLTPYPGKCLPAGEDSFNFHLSQLRVKIVQRYGILVGMWDILWRPLRVQFSGHMIEDLSNEDLVEMNSDEDVDEIEQGEAGQSSAAAPPPAPPYAQP